MKNIFLLLSIPKFLAQETRHAALVSEQKLDPKSMYVAPLIHYSKLETTSLKASHYMA